MGGYATPIDQVGDKDADFFQCSWGKIPITLRCDGTNNCGDNSDEESCEKASMVMIASGSTRKTEIVDVANGLTCSDLAEFPVEISYAVGANLGGTPVVCGGSSSGYSEKCFKFKNSGWEQYASMKEKRWLAAAVMHNDRLHVFGGLYNTGSRLQTTETINVDGEVSYGPDLPAGVDSHAMTKINGTVSLLSGGETNTDYYSAKTWYYNHDTEAFTSGPDLLEGRFLHGSALNVDKMTKSKIVVVTGGYNGNGMDSTELLINGQWQTGPPLPKAIDAFSMLEKNGDTYVIGGSSDGGVSQSSIYQLSCSSGICSWTTLNQQLKVGRWSSVAIAVQDNFCT